MMEIPYGRQQIDEQDCEAVLGALRSASLTQGPAVEKFEEEFAHFVGAKYAVAVTNGTAALHLSCLALGVKPGSKVLVPGNTFAASANCVGYCGGKVEFLEMDPATNCLDFAALEKLLAQSKKGEYQGIVAVDYAGYPCDLERLKGIVEPHGLWILEDACHAPGASYKSSRGIAIRAGSCAYSAAAIFSFHPVKHIATGEGGMITTNDESLSRHLKKLRTHGITKTPAEFYRNPDGPWYMEMQELGFNYRMPDILCALGSSQLKKMPANLSRRQEIARSYEEELRGLPLVLPNVPGDVFHAYHLYVVRSPSRDELFSFLRERGVFCQVHYIPVYRHPYYERVNGPVSRPRNDAFYREAISLPMFHGLRPAEQAYVIKTIHEFFLSPASKL